jgi:hypothetical protein
MRIKTARVDPIAILAEEERLDDEVAVVRLAVLFPDIWVELLFPELRKEPNVSAGCWWEDVELELEEDSEFFWAGYFEQEAEPPNVGSKNKMSPKWWERWNRDGVSRSDHGSPF